MIEQLIVPEELMTSSPSETHEITIQYSHEHQIAYTAQSALDRAFEAVDFGGVQTVSH